MQLSFSSVYISLSSIFTWHSKSGIYWGWVYINNIKFFTKFIQNLQNIVYNTKLDQTKRNSSHGSFFLPIFGLHCRQGGQAPPVLSQPGFWGWWPHFWWCSGFYKSQLICLQSQTCCSAGRWWWTGRFWFVPETELICVSAWHSLNPLCAGGAHRAKVKTAAADKELPSDSPVWSSCS